MGKMKDIDDIGAAWVAAGRDPAELIDILLNNSLQGWELYVIQLENAENDKLKADAYHQLTVDCGDRNEDGTPNPFPALELVPIYNRTDAIQRIADVVAPKNNEQRRDVRKQLNQVFAKIDKKKAAETKPEKSKYSSNSDPEINAVDRQTERDNIKSSTPWITDEQLDRMLYLADELVHAEAAWVDLQARGVPPDKRSWFAHAYRDAGKNVVARKSAIWTENWRQTPFWIFSHAQQFYSAGSGSFYDLKLNLQPSPIDIIESLPCAYKILPSGITSTGRTRPARLEKNSDNIAEMKNTHHHAVLPVLPIAGADFRAWDVGFFENRPRLIRTDMGQRIVMSRHDSSTGPMIRYVPVDDDQAYGGAGWDAIDWDTILPSDRYTPADEATISDLAQRAITDAEALHQWYTGMDVRALCFAVAAIICARVIGNRGNILWFTGPSGTGKSTTIMMASVICGDQPAFLSLTASDDSKFTQECGYALSRGPALIAFDECAKSMRGKEYSRLQPRLLRLNEKLTWRPLFGSPRTDPINCAIMATDTALPHRIGSDLQLSRRSIEYNLSRVTRYTGPNIGDFRGSCDDAALSCDVIASRCFDLCKAARWDIKYLAPWLGAGSLAGVGGCTDEQAHVRQVLFLIWRTSYLISENRQIEAIHERFGSSKYVHPTDRGSFNRHHGYLNILDDDLNEAHDLLSRLTGRDLSEVIDGGKKERESLIYTLQDIATETPWPDILGIDNIELKVRSHGKAIGIKFINYNCNKRHNNNITSIDQLPNINEQLQKLIIEQENPHYPK